MYFMINGLKQQNLKTAELICETDLIFGMHWLIPPFRKCG